MKRFNPLPFVASFLAGAIIPIPGYLLLLVGWVPALQASLLLSSLVCILAASAPWWTDAIETRRIARMAAQADHDANAYFSSEDFREEQLFHSREAFEAYREAWGSDPEDRA